MKQKVNETKSLLFVITKIYPGITQIPNMFKKTLDSFHSSNIGS